MSKPKVPEGYRRVAGPHEETGSRAVIEVYFLKRPDGPGRYFVRIHETLNDTWYTVEGISKDALKMLRNCLNDVVDDKVANYLE